MSDTIPERKRLQVEIAAQLLAASFQRAGTSKVEYTNEGLELLSDPFQFSNAMFFADILLHEAGL